MLKEIVHIGLTVSNLEKSVNFYKNILGLDIVGHLEMEGPETDLLFNRQNVKVKIAYLKGNNNIISPPVELIQFIGDDAKKDIADLHKTSISEICFKVDDIDEVYNKFLEHKVECLSEPQTFDFSNYGFGKSKAIYFKDPDGIILELSQPIEN